MSLHNLANHVQSLGRGKDSQLVHMTPREVGGLQTLAKAHGGSLSINPNTGLPEAGFLSDILPTIAGSVVGAYAGPWAGAAVGGGLGYAMSGGNLQKGLMSGIGAYGGSQLGANMMDTGNADYLAKMAPQAELTATQALPGYSGQAPISLQEAVAQHNVGALSDNQYQEYTSAYQKALGNIPENLSYTDKLGKSAMPLGMLALGAIGAANSGTTGINAPAGTPTPGYIRPSTYSQTKNPNFGQPGQPYFNQSYTAQTPILASNYNTTAMYPQPTTAAGGGLMSLAGGGMAMDQNPMYPGSQQVPSQYATPLQMPISSNVINASYEPKTDPYSGQMMASGGIAALRFDNGGDVQKTGSTWTPDQPVKLQTMTQMLGSEEDRAGGKSFNPTEHGYKWDTEYGKFMNPNGSTLSVNLDGSVSSATPAYKDYEFNKNGYFQPAGENVTLNPDTSTSAYKIGGVEVPIGREHTKGIAAYTDQAGKPQMQKDQAGQAIFTEPEGLRYTGNFMADTGAPMIAGTLLGGTAALAGGAFGSAGTTMAGEAAASGAGGAGGAGNAPVYSFDAPYTASNAIPSAVPSAVANAVPPAGSLMPNSNYMLGTYLASQALGGMGGGGGGGDVGGGIGNPYPTTSALQIPQYNSATHQYVNAAQGGIMGHYASGGIANLGGYSDGGRLLKGPGDGVSDSIPAQIGNNQPARLADGEFVVPARIVSELGNGSTEAGAKQLYKMMDRIQAKRRKTKNMATDTKSYKALPA